MPPRHRRGVASEGGDARRVRGRDRPRRADDRSLRRRCHWSTIDDDDNDDGDVDDDDDGGGDIREDGEDGTDPRGRREEGEGE